MLVGHKLSPPTGCTVGSEGCWVDIAIDGTGLVTRGVGGDGAVALLLDKYGRRCSAAEIKSRLLPGFGGLGVMSFGGLGGESIIGLKLIAVLVLLT